MKPFNKVLRERKISEIGFKTNWNLDRNCEYIDDYLHINAINLDLSETIFRIFDWKYFIEDLYDKKLTLLKTMKWLNQDPFENFITNSKVSCRGRFGKIDNSYFGSCWTLQSDCDGLWRNFSSNKRKCVVKVKTSTKKLFTTIYNINNPLHSSKYYIGKVKYIKKSAISDLFNHSYKKSELDDGFLFVQQLFLKRKQFSYENEVRIIVKEDSNDDKIKIPIDPNSLFDEIILDPFISTSNFSRKKKEIEKAGYTGSILQSDLYSKPSFNLKIK
ncbi:MAG: DUF2971 domain-containing protein [Prolixibacteraceae bacterium]|nr:DUF2971 domain-containing protein [Prolixibacteraceae bacterium]